ncbi:hypothetical protein Vadar_020990 [Vaccinium darrowii]|uniref:Uncharacterized protein n=1 Tax=Vaccinium darrowii TaxID=229202 RepID=A0ACB7YH60_9ERIC|nr:hypothetical protein Vadar_020990 [Vaccinium darrowii]
MCSCSFVHGLDSRLLTIEVHSSFYFVGDIYQILPSEETKHRAVDTETQRMVVQHPSSSRCSRKSKGGQEEKVK